MKLGVPEVGRGMALFTLQCRRGTFLPHKMAQLVDAYLRVLKSWLTASFEIF